MILWGEKVANRPFDIFIMELKILMLLNQSWLLLSNIAVWILHVCQRMNWWIFFVPNSWLSGVADHLLGINEAHKTDSWSAGSIANHVWGNKPVALPYRCWHAHRIVWREVLTQRGWHKMTTNLQKTFSMIKYKFNLVDHKTLSHNCHMNDRHNDNWAIKTMDKNSRPISIGNGWILISHIK